jgi:hypothetical protein
LCLSLNGAEPLLTIADAAGGAWPETARRALIDLCAEGQAADDSVGQLLLADIRQIFGVQDVDRLASAELVEELAGLETSPWGEWSQGKALSAAKLARLLRCFGIAPHSIRIGDRTPKGYLREDFEDAFRRYLRLAELPQPSIATPQSATPQQDNADDRFYDVRKRNGYSDVADSIWPKTNIYEPCCGVALRASPEGALKGPRT